MSLIVNAAPANDKPIILTQPSGKTFTARRHGDEWNNWITTKEGYGIYKNVANGNWEYYLPSADKKGIASNNISKLVVGEITPDKFDIPKGLQPFKTVKKAPIKQRNSSISFSPGNSLIINDPVVGQRHLLAICVDFSDTKATYNPSDIQPLIFEENNSVSDFYEKASYSAVSIIPALESNGVANDGVIGWIHLDYNHPNTGADTDERNQQLAYDAIEKADPYIDYSYYDFNNDNVISPDELSIIIIVAGYEAGGSGSPSIWGHSWSMWKLPNYPNFDGKEMREYAEFAEKQDDHLVTIGVMAHELGHLIFSLPDLYDNEPRHAGDSYGIGFFDLMGYGCWGAKSGEYDGATPTQLSAWSREYLSWGKVNTIDSKQVISLTKTDSDSSSVFRVNTSDPNQYFLIENRQFSGYDKGFQRNAEASGHGGLVIYHIDIFKTLFSDANADVQDKGVDVEEANEGILGYSMLDTKKSLINTQMFFFAGNNSEFTNETTPSSRLKNSSHSGISITGVSQYGENMTAEISLNDTPKVKLTAEILSHSPWVVKFTAATNPLDGKITNYEWDSDGDEKYDTNTTDSTLSITYNTYGTYSAGAKVTYINGVISEAVVHVGIRMPSQPEGNINQVFPGSAGRVDGHDLYDFAKAFGSEPKDTNWNLNADLNDNLIIDGNDLALIGLNFGK